MFNSSSFANILDWLQRKQGTQTALLVKNWNGLLGTIVSNWISCSWNVFWSKLSHVLANKGHMGLQECGQNIIFLNEEGMDCKIILKHTLTDNVVPAALKYPSHNLCEVPCFICISYWKDWGAKNLMPCFYLWQPWKKAFSVALPVCLMQEISCLWGLDMPKEWKIRELDRRRLLQIKAERCFHKLFYW